MIRPLFACVCSALLFADSVSAQAVATFSPYNPEVPPSGQYFNSGVPLVGVVPGLNFAPGNTVAFVGARGVAVPFTYNGFSQPFGLPYSPYGMFAYDAPLNGAYYAPYYLPFTTPIPSNDFPAPPLQPTGVGPITTFKLTGLPASLTMQFPASADVWLNGKRVEGTAAIKQEFTSPTLKPGQQYTFDIKAEWISNGKNYEYSRAVKVPAGDRAKVTVLAGSPKGEPESKEK